MKKKYFFVFSVITLNLFCISQVKANTQEKIIEGLLSIESPLDRLKAIKSTLSEFSDTKARIQFMRGYIAEKNSTTRLFKNIKKENIVFTRYENGKNYVIYNGENIGEGFSALLLGENIVFERFVGKEKHIIFNGKDMGQGSYPLLSNNNIAFTRNGRAIYNGEDFGEFLHIILSGDNILLIGKKTHNEQYSVIYNGKQSWALPVSDTLPVYKSKGNNLAFEVVQKNNEHHIIFNGKDVGIGTNISLYGENLAFERIISGIRHVIYNGKDLGAIIEGSIKLSNNNIAFLREINGVTHVIYNEKDLGVGNGIVLEGNNISFNRIINNESHVIYNGKDLGTFMSGTVFLSKNNIVFGRNIDGFIHIIHNGQDLGVYEKYKDKYQWNRLGIQWSFWENNIVFSKSINNVLHIIHNGKDLGEGYYPRFYDGKLLYTKDINNKPHLIYDGIDLGEMTNAHSYKYINGNVILFREINKNTHVIYNGEDLGITSSIDTVSLESDSVFVDGQMRYGIDKSGVYKEIGTSVICTELFRQGVISSEWYIADHQYAQKYISETVIRGYHYWAIPVTKLMKKSVFITNLVKPFGKAWAQHMAYKMGVTNKDSLLGGILETIGMPISYYIGEHIQPIKSVALIPKN